MYTIFLQQIISDILIVVLSFFNCRLCVPYHCEDVSGCKNSSSYRLHRILALSPSLTVPRSKLWTSLETEHNFIVISHNIKPNHSSATQKHTLTRWIQLDPDPNTRFSPNWTWPRSRWESQFHHQYDMIWRGSRKTKMMRMVMV